MDEYTHSAKAIIPQRSFRAAGVVAVLEYKHRRTRYPRPMTGATLIDWCNFAGIETAFIDPGSPWPNGFIGSF
jgi:hypothetical protein